MAETSMRKRTIFSLALWVTISASMINAATKSKLKSFNFSAPDSTVHVTPGAQFTFGDNPSFIWDGTLQQAHGASITEGITITFSDGTFQDQLGTQLINADYVTSDSGGQMLLKGSDRYETQEGIIRHGFVVSGDYNRIEGTGTILNPIRLVDSSSTVTLALMSVLAGDVILNNGQVWLDDMLRFADMRRFKTDGVVNMDDNRVSLGAAKDTWDNKIVWHNGNDLVLNGDVNLSGTWTFSADSTIVGNGNCINMLAGGVIWIKHNTRLRVSDLKIRGVKNGAITFENKGREDIDTGSRMVLSETHITFDETTTFTTGGFYIKGESMFIVGDKRVILQNEASMTVDRVTMWVDHVGGGSGQIIFGDPAVADRDLYEANYRTLKNKGIIREVANPESDEGGGSGGGGSEDGITLEDVSGTYTYDSRKIIDFYPSASLAFNLTMSDATVVVQHMNQDVTLKSNDHILIMGRNNAFYVRKTFTINSSFNFEEGSHSEVTFNFDDTHADPKVIFNTNIRINPGCRMVFKGRGKVQFPNGHTINLDGANEGNHHTEFVLDDHAIFELQNADSESIIKGNGRVIVDNKAEINVSDRRQLTFFEDASDLSSSVTLKVQNNARMYVHGERSGISFRRGLYDLQFEQDGRFHVGRAGKVFINAYQDVVNRTVTSAPGRLLNWTFKTGARFNVDGGSDVVDNGQLILNDNINDTNVIPGAGSSGPTTWNSLDAQIQGLGGIQYLPEPDFHGVINPQAWFKESNLTILELTKLILQRARHQDGNIDADVVDATVFRPAGVRDTTGTRLNVRLRNGTIHTLADNEVVTREDRNLGHVRVHNKDTGETRTLRTDGTTS